MNSFIGYMKFLDGNFNKIYSSSISHVIMLNISVINDGVVEGSLKLMANLIYYVLF